MKKLYIIIPLLYCMQYANGQTWNITGNSGLTTSNFLGTTDSKDLIFKVNNIERGRLFATNGSWRFGNATNFAKIDSSGKLTFSGTGAYQVAGNKYAFQYTSNPNYGLFFNSTSVQYEFRNGSAVPVFSVNANTGNSIFNGTVKVGAYTLPATDGASGQLLKTNGAGTLTWSSDNGTSYTAGTGISITSPGNAITNTAPDQVVTINGTGGTTVMGMYPNFTISSGTSSSGWSLTGNAGTNPATNFIGTTDVQPLVFRVNNQKAGLIDYDVQKANTGLGYHSLLANTTGNNNTANGTEALLQNTTGNENTGCGSAALYSNTTGSANTSNGKQSLFSNSTGGSNTANGSHSLYSNTTGSANTAIGYASLFNSIAGTNNTAVGYSADINSLVVNNNATVIGSNAYADCSNCMVLGSISGVNGATASVKVGIGTIAPGAALDVQSVIWGTAIHAVSTVSSGNGLVGECDAISNPYGVWGLCNNTSDGYAGYFEGNLHYTGIISGPSDQKLKENIKPADKMLDKIMQLRPSLYNFKAEYKKMNLPQGRQMGFIAQDMEKVFPQLVVRAFDKQVDSGKIFEYKAINYIGLIPALTKAIQELAVQNDSLKSGNNALVSVNNKQQQQIDKLIALADNLQQQITELKATQQACCNNSSTLSETGNLSSKINNDAARLEQNAPNPFNNNTIIKYYLPSKTNSAQVVITDVNGRTIKSISVSNKGAGQITVSANTLSPGTYFYSLLVDGKKIDTKQMELLK